MERVQRPTTTVPACSTMPTVAVRPTTTTSACTSIAHHGRLCNHHDFDLCCDCPSWPCVQPARLRPVTLLPTAAVCATPTTSACAVTVHSRRPLNHHDFGQRRYCRSEPPIQPPRLQPVTRLPVAAVRPTTTTSACAATAIAAVGTTTTASACASIADRDRRLNHHDFGLWRCWSSRPWPRTHHDFGQRRC